MESSIQIEISDNGIGREASQRLKTGNQLEHKSTAMKNITKRINLIENIYKHPIDVQITNLEPGTLVQITLPKITEK